MAQPTVYKIALIVLVVVVLLGNFQLQNLRKDKATLQAALSDANDNIEEANSIIEEAQGYAWSDYEDMGSALENLYTVDTVFDPTSTGGPIRLPSLNLPRLPQLPRLL